MIGGDWTKGHTVALAIMYEVVTSEIPMINAEELKFSIESGLIHTVASLMIIILAQVTTYVVVAAVFPSWSNWFPLGYHALPYCCPSRPRTCVRCSYCNVDSAATERIYGEDDYDCFGYGYDNTRKRRGDGRNTVVGNAL